jgi:protein-glutamine gamma-glutamyltransferase
MSLIISGEVNYLMSLTGIGLFPGYYRFLKGMPQASKWTIGGLSLLTLVVFFIDSLIISNDYFLGVAHLTIAFQAIKSFDLKEPWDHLQVYFVALLQLIVASELTNSIVFGVIFILFVIVFVAAIVLAHFIKERTTIISGIKRPVAYISSLALLLTVVFFISIPRTPGGLWGKVHTKSIRTVGFSDKVYFGSFGDIKTDPTVVMRIEIKGKADSNYYWRGMSLNYFDGISWKDTFGERERVSKKDDRFIIMPFQKDSAVVQRIFLEPMDTDVIFGLTDIAAVDAAGPTLFKDYAGSLFMPAKKGKRFNYTVYSIQKLERFHGNVADYLQLPSGSDRISKLAHEIVGGIHKEPDKALKIEKYLTKNYTYSLSTSKPPEGTGPIEDFLFNSRKGYCEYYATAMVLMLRTLGIPARIVTGFFGGELNEYGGYIIIRQSNAHSWVEAVIDGNWRIFDPTPAVPAERPSTFALYMDMLKMKWSRYVIAFSSADQKSIVKGFSMPFSLPQMPGFRLCISWAVVYGIAALSVILTALFLIKKASSRRYGIASAQYIKLRTLIRKKGAKISPSSTPAEVKKELMRFGINNKAAEFIALYERYRFGGIEIKREDRARLQRLMREIAEQIRS